jgi:recombination protein RecT
VSNQLAVVESGLKALVPQFAQALAGRMPPERLIRTVLVSLDRTPKLLNCTQQSIFNGAMTFAILGLEVDGVTGQGFLLPFAGKAQPVIGYKGFATLGARAGLTITGEVVREGDDFDYMLGTGSFVKHRPKLGNDGRIIAAWAQAESRERPPIITVMGLSDLEAVRKKSPGAKMADSPWNDPSVGLPAMYAKTPKRRLSRSTPLALMQPEFHMAATMEENFDERGRYSYIDNERRVITVDETLPTRQGADQTPALQDLTGQPPNAEMEGLKVLLLEAAEGGMGVLATAWRGLTGRQQHALERWKEDIAKPAAQKADVEHGDPL